MKLRNDLLVPGARRQLVNHADIGPGEDGMNWMQIRGLPEVRQVRSLSPVQELCILRVNRCSRQLQAPPKRHGSTTPSGKLAVGASGLPMDLDLVRCGGQPTSPRGRPPTASWNRKSQLSLAEIPIVVEQRLVGNQVTLSDLLRALSGQSTVLGRNRPNNGLVLARLSGSTSLQRHRSVGSAVSRPKLESAKAILAATRVTIPQFTGNELRAIRMTTACNLCRCAEFRPMLSVGLYFWFVYSDTFVMTEFKPALPPPSRPPVMKMSARRRRPACTALGAGVC